MRRNTWLMMVAVASAAVLPLMGCGDDDPVGPQQGTVEAAVVDEGEASEMLRGDGLIAFSASDHVSGEFRGTARVQVFVDDVWQDLSGITDVSLTAGLGTSEQTWGSAQASARTYDRVRIVLADAEAEVDAGSDLGAGPIEASVTVSINGGGDVFVELAAPITVQANATTRVVLDLQSHVWLDQESVQAGAVTAAAFEGAAQLVVASS